MATETVVRRVGNSLGIIFSKEFVRDAGIAPNDEIAIEIVKKANIRGVFNTLKRKTTGQEFKDFVRNGWK